MIFAGCLEDGSGPLAFYSNGASVVSKRQVGGKRIRAGEEQEVAGAVRAGVDKKASSSYLFAHLPGHRVKANLYKMCIDCVTID